MRYLWRPPGTAALADDRFGTIPVTSILRERMLDVRKIEVNGIRVIGAVHDARAGIPLGGVLVRPFAGTLEEEVVMVEKSARAMTFKAAGALRDGAVVGNFPFGGATIGIFYSPETYDVGNPGHRGNIFSIAGLLARSFDGEAVFAPDSGSGGPKDMMWMAGTSGRTMILNLPLENGGTGTPGRFTGAGVYAAIRAVAGSVKDSPVALLGFGDAGSHLGRLLKQAGARLLIAEHNEARRQQAVECLGATAITSEEALEEPHFILCPCGFAGVINPGNVDRIRAEWIIGSANNMVAGGLQTEERMGGRYVPFEIATGGRLRQALVEVECRRRGEPFDPARAWMLVKEIGDLARLLYNDAEAAGVTPARLFRQRVSARLEQLEHEAE